MHTISLDDTGPVTNRVTSPADESAGRRFVCAGWRGTGAIPASGMGNTVVATIARDSSLTWLWEPEYRLQVAASEGGSVAPKSGWISDGTAMRLTATPSNGYEFACWQGDVPMDGQTNNPLTVIMNRPRSISALFRQANGVYATHWSELGSYFPGDNVISCRFFVPDISELLSLNWEPLLPEGWEVVGVQGDGFPLVIGNQIIFTHSHVRSPVMFSYTVRVPTSSTGVREIRGRATYQIQGMSNPVETMARPNPLLLALHPYNYHDADYRELRWVIDAIELSRVLSYWRSGWYQPDPVGFDGYSPTTKLWSMTATNGCHSADYQEKFWKISTSEANRVLAYWRAGGYRIDPDGADGYMAAPGVPGFTKSATTVATKATPTALAIAPIDVTDTISYDPGGTVTITNVVSFGSDLLALCVNPQLPPGWTLISVRAEGNPEISDNGILWTGNLPASPVTIVYTVRVPVTAYGDKAISADVEAYLEGDANPTSQPTPEVDVPMVPTDTDGDGLPDAWEDAFGLGSDLDPGDDDDADFMSNLDEWRAGTVPTNRESVLRLQGMALSNGWTRLRWQSATGRSYKVSSGPSASATGVTIRSTLMSSPPENTLDIETGDGRSQFYRIHVEQ